MLDRQRRAIVGQVGMVILLNIVIGFSIPRIDNMAHIGGLVAGLWLGLLFVPGRVRTLSSLWHRGSDNEKGRSMVLPVAGAAALVVVLVAGVVYGTDVRRPDQAGLDGALFQPVAGDWFDPTTFNPGSPYIDVLADARPVDDESRAREVAIGFTRLTLGDVSLRVVDVDLGPIANHCDVACEPLEWVGTRNLWAVTLDVAGGGIDGRYRIALDPTIGTPVGVLEAVPSGG
jgi:hypothetical protein